MRMDVKTTALLAALMLGLERGNFIVGQALLIPRVSHLRWFEFLALFGNALLLVPLPVVLALVYTSRVAPVVTRPLRYLGWATVLVQGLFIAAPTLYRLSMELSRDWGNVRLFEGSTVAANMWAWFRTGDLRILMLGTLDLLAKLALPLFLVALVRQEDVGGKAGPAPARGLRRTAQLAVLAAGLAVVFSIGRQVYAAANYDTTLQFWNIGRGQIVLRNALSGLPIYCLAATAWLIYKSLVRASAKAAEP